MGGGNKKNKRPSLTNAAASLTLSPKIELIERTPDNDYGVLSDPDEQPTPTTETETLTATATATETLPPSSASAPEHQPAPAVESLHEYSYNQNERLEPSHSSHSSAQSSPLSSAQLSPVAQEPDLSIQPSISQPPASNKNKSLETLKLKLTRDKNFSRKITLHTFFSYIILAMEIQRSCSASIAQLDIKSVQDLIVYMIDNHTASNPVRIYLHTLNDTGVVKNIIESIIEFNRDNKSSSIETLYTHEENELEMFIIEGTRPEVQEQETTTTTTMTTTTTAPNDVSISQHQDTPAPRRCGIFKRMRNFFSGCCCGCK